MLFSSLSLPYPAWLCGWVWLLSQSCFPASSCLLFHPGPPYTCSGFISRVHHAGSGRVLEVYTTQPGVQFYTGNVLDGTLKGKSGAGYPKHSGFCLETQSWPDAVNQVSPQASLLEWWYVQGHTRWQRSQHSNQIWMIQKSVCSLLQVKVNIGNS